MTRAASMVSGLLCAPLPGGVSGRDGVWRLEGSSRDVEALKTRLLTAICSCASPVVHYDEPPVRSGSLQRVEKLAASVWRIPSNADGAELLSWLYLGNWQLYVGSRVLDKLPDLCRASPAEVGYFMVAAGVEVVIDSFHDDTCWTVGALQAPRDSGV